jgi:hypothetical protein
MMPTTKYPTNPLLMIHYTQIVIEKVDLVKKISIMCKFAHVKKFKILVSLY